MDYTKKLTLKILRNRAFCQRTAVYKSYVLYKKYVLYKNMLIFSEFFNTQSDQNILPKRTKLHHILKFFSGEPAYALNSNYN